MNIYVTGIAGAIGSHIAERFNAQGYRVAGIDAFTDFYDPALKRATAAELAAQGIEVQEDDLVAADLTTLIPDDVDFVFHAAGQPGMAAGMPFDAYVRNNITATDRLLAELRRKKRTPKLVCISTSSVYGAYANGDEEMLPKPNSDYGVTKLAAEQWVLTQFREHAFPATSLRLFSIYGERERPDKLFRKLIDAVEKGEPFPLYEGSEQHLRSYTYVGDVVDACVLVTTQFDACAGEVFNIGTDQTNTTGEGIALVEELMGKKAVFRSLPPREGEQLQTSANIDKARRVFGYDPKTSLRDGLEKMVAWYRRTAA